MSRQIAISVLMFSVGLCAILFARGTSFAAQNNKKTDPDDKVIKNLKQDLAEANQHIKVLKAQVSNLQAQNNKLEAYIKKDRIADKKDDAQDAKVASMLSGLQSAGLVHVVVLKLKSDSAPSSVQALIDDVDDLRKIKTVRGLWFGKPSAKAASDTPPQDFSVSMVILFDNYGGLKQYLDDPAYKKFVNKHLKKWETPSVYDFDTKK